MCNGKWMCDKRSSNGVIMKWIAYACRWLVVECWSGWQQIADYTCVFRNHYGGRRCTRFYFFQQSYFLNCFLKKTIQKTMASSRRKFTRLTIYILYFSANTVRGRSLLICHRKQYSFIKTTFSESISDIGSAQGSFIAEVFHLSPSKSVFFANEVLGHFEHADLTRVALL